MTNRICTSPVIKGGGEPLFRPASTGTVELLDTKILATGAVIHAYARPRPADPNRATSSLFDGDRSSDWQARCCRVC